MQNVEKPSDTPDYKTALTGGIGVNTFIFKLLLSDYGILPLRVRMTGLLMVDRGYEVRRFVHAVMANWIFGQNAAPHYPLLTLPNTVILNGA